MSLAAIVPAAGAGTRFGASAEKLFAPLGGMPLLASTLRALEHVPEIRWILPVVRAGDERRVAELAEGAGISKAMPPCVGGASRAESVARGLTTLPPAVAWVLIHDGARPCVTPELLREAIRAGKRHGAVACGVPASVTVKAVDEDDVVRLTLDRDTLRFIQTPQVIRRDWFAEALCCAGASLASFPDDISLVEAAGFPARVIPGDPLNMKVTTPEDLWLAQAVLARRERAAHNGRVPRVAPVRRRGEIMDANRHRV